jgi:hypothetical protein
VARSREEHETNINEQYRVGADARVDASRGGRSPELLAVETSGLRAGVTSAGRETRSDQPTTGFAYPRSEVGDQRVQSSQPAGVVFGRRRCAVIGREGLVRQALMNEQQYQQFGESLAMIPSSTDHNHIAAGAERRE